MTVESDRDRGIRLLVIAAALVIIIGGINQAQSVLVSFLVAVLFVLSTPRSFADLRQRILGGAEKQQKWKEHDHLSYSRE
jgi:predicted PurR-regulated permease PerM